MARTPRSCRRLINLRGERPRLKDAPTSVIPGLPENAEVDAIVSSLFKVKDRYAMEEGATEFSVEYDEGTRAAFRTLCGKLHPLGFTPHLTGTKDSASLSVVKDVPRPPSAARTPVFLSLLTAVSIVATGWAVGIVYSSAIGGDSIAIGATFAAGVTAVLLAKEGAHWYVSRRYGGVTSTPYYLPNIPLFVSLPVLYFLPTFGSVTFLRSPSLDRDSLFDFYFVGAVAAVAAALAVALAGSAHAVVFAAGTSGTLTTNPSVLQAAALLIGGSASATVPAGDIGLFSPLEVAAWVGFLIAFFSLLPAALLDGGRMSTLVLGERGSRLTTMAAAFLLVAIDVPNYWVLFLLIFLLAAVQPSSETLDSVTGISRSRKLLFLAAMALVVLSIPIPQTFLTYPL